MKNIQGVLVTNLGDYHLLKKNEFDFSERIIITTSIGLVQYCKNNNIKHINLCRFLNDDIISQANANAESIVRDFRVPYAGELEYKGISVFDTVKGRLHTFYTGVFHSSLSFSKLLEEYEITQIHIRKNKTVSMGAGFERSHVLDGVVEYICRNRNISVQHLDFQRQNQSSKEREKTGYDLSEFAFDHDKINENTGNERLLFILSENFEWDFELVRHVLANIKLDVFVVWRGPEHVNNSLQLEACPLYFSDFSIPDDSQSELHKLLDKSKKEYFENIDQYNGAFRELFGNRYLNFEFRKFYKVLETCLADLSTFDRVHDFLTPDKIYFSNSWDMSVRCMIQRARQLGSKNYATIHGGVICNSGYAQRTFDIDNYLVWGKDNYDGLIKAGQEPESIKVVGSMQMDSWNEKIKQIRNGTVIDKNKEYSHIFDFNPGKLKNDDRFTVIYFTSDGGGFSGHTINEVRHASTIAGIFQLADRLPHVNFRFKPHVLYDYGDLWKQHEGQLLGNMEILSGRDLMKACLESDLCVLINTFSNVAYEIALSGKPLIYLKDAVFHVDMNESTLERGGILCLDSVKEFERYLEKYLSSAKLKKDLEDRRLRFLSYALAPLDNSTRERIEELFLRENELRNKPENRTNNSDIYTTVNWVREFVNRDKLSPFPDVKNQNVYPKGRYLLPWLYNVTENWCAYYNKENLISRYYPLLVSKVPSKYGVPYMQKIKLLMLTHLRDFYSTHRLYEKGLFKVFHGKRKWIAQ